LGNQTGEEKTIVGVQKGDRRGATNNKRRRGGTQERSEKNFSSLLRKKSTDMTASNTENREGHTEVRLKLVGSD